MKAPDGGCLDGCIYTHGHMNTGEDHGSAKHGVIGFHALVIRRQAHIDLDKF